MSRHAGAGNQTWVPQESRQPAFLAAEPSSSSAPTEPSLFELGACRLAIGPQGSARLHFPWLGLKCIPPCLDFCLGSVDQNQLLVLAWQGLPTKLSPKCPPPTFSEGLVWVSGFNIMPFLASVHLPVLHSSFTGALGHPLQTSTVPGLILSPSVTILSSPPSGHHPLFSSVLWLLWCALSVGQRDISDSPHTGSTLDSSTPD